MAQRTSSPERRPRDRASERDRAATRPQLPPRVVASNPLRPLRRQSAIPLDARRNTRGEGRRSLFGWGDNLTRAERERAQSRMAFLGLSAVVALVLLLVGGTLLYDKVYLAERPVLRVDGQPVSLRAYTNLLSYEMNRLETFYINASSMGNQMAVQQIQQRLVGLTQALPEEIIDERIIRAEAAKRGITATPAEIDAELKELVGYRDPNATPVPTPATTPVATAAAGETEATAPTAVPSPQATAVPTRTPTRSQQRAETFDARYRDYQRLTGGTDAVIRGQVEYDILRRKLFEEIGKTTPTSAEQVRARHILVSDEGVARTVVERLRAGESFEAIAAEVSADTSNSQNGGDLGWFGRGAMVKEFEDAAFALQPGQISEPVKTSFGWHIIRVDERDANRVLEGQALENARNQALQSWMDEAKKDHRIERLITQDMMDWAERNGRRSSQLMR
jgi:peptidyl-prolyl cis-trans isomerase D